MGLPLKDAVEHFLTLKYGERIEAGELTKTHIWREDKRLYEAIHYYERAYGKLPFDIPSQRELADRQLLEFIREGVAAMTPRQRLAVKKRRKRIMARRASAENS